MGGEMLMPVDNIQTETVETTETETTETVETTETPETKTEETVETPETATDTETTETVEETKEETTTETDTEEETPEDETPADEDTEDEEQDDKSDDKSEITALTKKYKAEQKKVESLKSQVKGLETVVSSIIDAKMSDIPKEYHALIPEGNMVSKLEWINKAEVSGLFAKKANPDVEIGKPLNLGDKRAKATSNATAQQKLSNYFSNLYSK
jgi:Na+-transporting NADH:ubiquinone oxidoreductase subunit NqrC